MVFLVNEFFMS